MDVVGQIRRNKRTREGVWGRERARHCRGFEAGGFFLEGVCVCVGVHFGGHFQCFVSFFFGIDFLIGFEPLLGWSWALLGRSWGGLGGVLERSRLKATKS